MSGGGFGVGLVATAFVLGLRHGIDWDHLAAITDIAGTQENTRRSMLMATMYACGHGAVVLALGILALGFGQEIPQSVDSVMTRVVGVTLILLGVYVLVGLVRQRRDFRLRSRWMLLFVLMRRGRARLGELGGGSTDLVEIEHDHVHHHDHDHAESGAHEHTHARVPQPVGGPSVGPPHSHRHAHRLPAPEDPFPTYRRTGALGVGVLHGVGAETPTQVVILLGAAGATGLATGVLVLVVFIAGIMVSNTGIALGATYGFLNASKGGAAYLVVSASTAVVSLVIGAVFLLGASASLPALLGG